MHIIAKKFIDQLSYEIIGATIEVHKQMGPGLLESLYHACMKEELKQREIPFVSGMIIPIKYREIDLDALLRCDLFVENLIVEELKVLRKRYPFTKPRLLLT